MIQALPHGSIPRRRQPGTPRTGGSACCFPSQIPLPRTSRDSPLPPPTCGPSAPPGPPYLSVRPRAGGGGPGAGAEGEKAPEPAPLAAESSFLPRCRLGGPRGGQRPATRGGAASPACGGQGAAPAAPCRGAPARRHRHGPWARRAAAPAAPDVASPGRAA